MRERHGRGLQGRHKVGFATFIWALVVQALCGRGSLGHHLRTLSGVNISDSSAHERSQGLNWEWFEDLFTSFLRPLAQRGEHAQSFYHEMRLLAIDGTQWSLRNAPAIAALPRQRSLTGCQSSSAAFVKWGCAVLVELGTHQPLAAACEQMQTEAQEGELTLARRLLGSIPRKEATLLLADRYYGRGSFIEEVLTTAGTHAQLLIRVPSPHKVQVQQALHDGSAVVEVRVCYPNSQRTKKVLTLREVRGEVWREGPESQKRTRSEVRLWTTLLDAQKYPAAELLALYAQRWEQELFFGELKAHTGREQLLRASSIQGAQIEWGALLIAASLVAQ